MANYSKEQLREIFQSPFSQEAWKAILHNLFKADRLRTKPELFTDPSDNEVGYHMGVTETPDNYRIGLFYYKVKTGSVAHKKVGLRNLVKGLLNPTWGKFDAAIVVFDSGREWRLSFVCDIKESATAPKRFTFVFGERDNHYRTPVDRFDKLQEQEVSFENIRKAFSVEALSDDFFRDYRDLYADFVEYITGKRYVKESNKWVERETGTPDRQYVDSFGGNDKLVRDYVKKMFGRIVFLYFLQRKGWLDGNRNYMHDLFAKSDKKEDFLDRVLEPLFFEVLNTDKPYRRITSRTIPGIDNIPYLNGGLFAKDDTDERPCVFPATYFARLFGFLDSYNFTIDENDTEDAEIGIDPEMLGRIFENLLEDNKDKGAFYTPKEIVSYMCRESIIAYLQDDKFSKEGNGLIRRFVETLDDTLLTREQRVYVKEKLKTVKICDPAIGSGAFPMGLVNLLSKLYSALRISSESSVIKRHIMEQSIYGVDIEQGAVDIARLRFWLAMIVEEKEPMPLPNLHFKIMQGNSLLESYNGVDLSDLTKFIQGRGTLDFGDNDEREALVRALRRYYNTSDHDERKRLFNEIIYNVRRQIHDKEVKLPTDFDPSANTDFFLWHTWFSDVFAQGGFDIVIGNPPYISTATQQTSSKLLKQRNDIVASKKYITLYQKWDIYVVFIEFGIQILNDSGILTMIVPFPLTNQIYAKKLREHILNKTRILEVVNLNGIKVFDNATVANCIPFIKKIDNPTNKEISISGIQGGSIICRLYAKKINNFIPDLNSNIWELEQKTRWIDKHSNLYTLGDFCYISKGMVLNADEKKAKGAFVKADLISDEKDVIHSRKYIEGKDIEKYGIKRVRYLEWGTQRCPNELSRPTFPELYSTSKLLMNALGELKVTADLEGDFCCEQQVRMGVLWHSLENINNKSIASSVKKYSSFSKSDLERISSFVNIPYLVGILNSKYTACLIADIRGGDYHIVPEYLRRIPIPLASQRGIEYMTSKVNQCVSDKQNVETIKADIDHIVYHLYGLSYDEVLIVDPETPISREEYDSFNIEEA